MERKSDLQRVNTVAREFGIDRIKFGECKDRGDEGTANNGVTHRHPTRNVLNLAAWENNWRTP